MTLYNNLDLSNILYGSGLAGSWSGTIGSSSYGCGFGGLGNGLLGMLLGGGYYGNCGWGTTTSCGTGSFNVGRVLGWAGGIAAFCLAAKGIGALVQNHRANSTSTLSSQVENYGTKIDGLIKTWGEEALTSGDITKSKWYTDTKAAIDNGGVYDEAKILDESEIESYKAVIKKYNKETIEEGKTTNLTYTRAQYDAAKKAIKESEDNAKIKKAMDSLEQQAKAKQKSLDKAKEQYEEYLAQQQEIQERLNQKVLDKVSTNKKKRTPASDFNSNYTVSTRNTDGHEGELFLNGTHKTAVVNDLYTAFDRWNQANTADQKKEAKFLFESIYNELNTNGTKIPDALVNAYKQVIQHS